MLNREARLGYGTTQNPDGLLVGVKVDDGNHFPPYAKDSQYADFEPFFLDGPAFLQSPLHLDFQKSVRSFAYEVARIVDRTPSWSAEWETDPWLENIVKNVQLPPRPQVAQPLIA